MARAPAGRPAGIRLGDHISPGVIAKAFPLDQVRRILADTGKASARGRDPPAQVVVYDAIALTLHMGAGTREVPRCLLAGLRWAGSGVRGRSGWRARARHLAGAHAPG